MPWQWREEKNLAERSFNNNRIRQQRQQQQKFHQIFSGKQEMRKTQTKKTFFWIAWNIPWFSAAPLRRLVVRKACSFLVEIHLVYVWRFIFHSPSNSESVPLAYLSFACWLFDTLTFVLKEMCTTARMSFGDLIKTDYILAKHYFFTATAARTSIVLSFSTKAKPDRKDNKMFSCCCSLIFRCFFVLAFHVHCLLLTCYNIYPAIGGPHSAHTLAVCTKHTYHHESRYPTNSIKFTRFWFVSILHLLQ